MCFHKGGLYTNVGMGLCVFVRGGYIEVMYFGLSPQQTVMSFSAWLCRRACY